RHPRAGNSDRKLGVVSGEVETAGKRNPNVAVSNVALLYVDPPSAGVDEEPQEKAVKDKRIDIVRRRGKHGIAGRLHDPRAAAFARRIELREDGDPIAAGSELKRNNQGLSRLVPIEAYFGTVDGDAHKRIIDVNHISLFNEHAAIHHAGNAIGAHI